MQTLSSHQTRAFIVDISKPTDNIQSFLKSMVLIINITSKDIDGFTKLVTEIEKSEVRKILFVSSTSVYPVDSGTVTESDGKVSPDHPLAIIENLFMQNQNIDATILRFAGLIGYSRHPGRFFRGGKTVKNPESNVNLIHRDDCINIIDRIVSKNLWRETFNCCADTHPSKREFYSQAARQLGAPLPEFEESNEKPFKIIDNQKVKRKLDYEFLYPDLMDIQFEQQT